MHRYIAAILFLTLVTLAPATSANPVDPSIIATARKMALDYLDAGIRVDVERMAALLDDQFQTVRPTGQGFQTVNKSQALNALRASYPMSPRILAPEAIPLEVVGNLVLVKAVTRDRVEVLSIYIAEPYRRIISSFVQHRTAELR